MDGDKTGTSTRTKGIPRSKMRKVLSKLNGTCWNALLLAQPRFSEYFDWKAGLASFVNDSWQISLACFSCGVAVAIRPELIDTISFENFTCGYEDFLALVPDKAEEFADRFDWWVHMGGDSWQQVLSAQPRFANRCKWGRLSGSNWSGLLQAQPQFSDKCVWSKLDGKDWSGLLRARPQFSDLCVWSRLDGKNWSELLQAQPRFADRCDWTKLEGENWYSLLWVRPEFADKCKSLRDETIDRMECHRIRLGICSENSAGWSKLNGEDWSRLLAERPELADHCDWTKLDGGDWSRVLRVRPQFADRCDWSKLSGKSYWGEPTDWGELLREQPRFADKCDWTQLDGNARQRILCAQPDLAEYFAERLSAKK